MRSFDVAALQEAYRTGKSQPREIVDEVLDRIARLDDEAVWISRVAPDELRAAAARLEGADPERLPLYGIPFAVKDNIDVAGLPTTAACPDFAYVATETAPAVQRLIDAGALLVGKTNLDQFATGLVGVRTPYGVCRNAIDPAMVPGGSSSGSAVAVAAGLVSFALGTDTAGSGRVPAGFNNIVGVKPTRGLVSTRGVVPACRTLDCISVFALAVEDGTAVLDVLAAYDAADPYSRRAPQAAETGVSSAGLDGVRFGVPAGEYLEFFGNGAYAAAFGEACDAAAALGATVTEIDFSPFAEVAALLYDGPWVAERFVALRDFLDRSPDAFHPVTRRIVESGRDITAADTFAAMYRLADLARRAGPVWEEVDAMLLPTAGAIYSVAEVEADPVRLNSNLGYYTNFVNLLDLSALAVPAGFTAAGLPFGITLVGPAFADARLAAMGSAIHGAAGLPMGATGVPVPERAVEGASERVAGPGDILMAVNGAHMRGLPLNYQLTDLGARFVREDRTESGYRLYALEDLDPIRPGMVRSADGTSIDVEVWAMPVAAVGRLLAQIPAPLGLGTIRLASGAEVKGFLCEPIALATARDITDHGGWRQYLRATAAGDRRASAR